MENAENIVDVANRYAALISAISTAAIALLTAFLWFENRALRRAGSSPDIVAYLLPHPEGTGAVEFILANVGRGPAFDVAFRFDCDKDDFAEHNVLLENDKDRTPLSVLPQGEKVKSLFGISFELYGKASDPDVGPLKRFTVDITYQDALGRSHRSRRAVDIKQFAGLKGILAKSSSAKSAETLDKIEKHLQAISRQAGRYVSLVDVTDIADQQRRKKKGDGPA
jgi:hypothetical protein